MHAPIPTYQFTIPSLADGLALDCRIHHPPPPPPGPPSPPHLRLLPETNHHPTDHEVPSSDKSSPRRAAGRRKKGAIVAHPYAPLGGTMDDPVVTTAVDQLLQLGFVVGTFNFRGAPGSKGKTTWTAKAERDDYVSFAGFLLHYLAQLDVWSGEAEDETCVPSVPSPSSSSSGENCTTTGHGQPQQQQQQQDSLDFVFGGYSYGSFIVTQLPTIADLIRTFEATCLSPRSPTAEILLRARSIAAQTNASMATSATTSRGRLPGTPIPTSSARGHRKSSSHHSVVYGGEETPPPLHDSRESSQEGPRRNVDVPLRIKRHMRRRSSRSHAASPNASCAADARARADGADGTAAAVMPGQSNQLPAVQPYYLLLSPLLAPLSSLLSLSLLSLVASKSADPETLVRNPTLVVFGSQDGFTSARRTRAWCQRMHDDGSRPDLGGSSSSVTNLTWHEQEGAGHFWREPGARRGLQAAIERWCQGCIAHRHSCEDGKERVNHP